MRAICGAIITAGALIGLGLTSLGLGSRYQGMVARGPGPESMLPYVHFKELDTATMIALVILLLSVLIGMGITFLGLAYHHERRHLEHLHRTSVGKMPVEP